MTINITKVIDVLDAEQGITEERVITHDENAPALDLSEAAPYPRDLYNRLTVDPQRAQHLQEAATGGLSTANFPDLLRLGIQFDLFSGFNERETTYPSFTRTVPSNDHQEEYGDDEGIGLPPIVAEGEPYPEVSPTLGGGVKIANYKRGFRINVTDEIQMFDKVGKVRDLANNIGRAHRMGREQSAYNVLTNTANYNDKNNNDSGNNNARDLQMTPTNLNLALSEMMTQKDVKSGQYLGVVPDTLVCGPLLERFVRMLIQSTALVRVGQGQDTAADVFGQGENNPFFGVVNRIVVAPLHGASYQWSLVERQRAIYFQEVEPLRLFIESQTSASSKWMERDVIQYKSRDWYGVGMRDDRFAFHSNTTTAPLAD